MSATYDETALDDDLNYIRWKIGDTDLQDALNSDEHINEVLRIEGSRSAAIVALADELIVRYGRQPKSVRLPSGLTVDFTERIAAWKRLVTRVEETTTAAAQVEETPVPTVATIVQAVW